VRIKEVKLTNFKRFSDFKIANIPESAKLVIIVGPNGSGKSSLFDAFWHWYRLKVNFGIHSDETYYKKDSNISFNWQDSVVIKMHNDDELIRGSFYIRTAYRNDPEFNVTEISNQIAPSQQIRISSLIQNDKTVSENYQRLIYETTAAVYNSANDTKLVRQLREELIGQIRISMKNVFGDLILNNISDPLQTGSFYFEKGVIKSYHYKNLSGGEKAAFDLILDLHVKKQYHPEAIYCIDEPEIHLHTRVQSALIKELVNIIPEKSQLWITTHSLGVLRAAQELNVTVPGSVSVIDFDGINPDEPTVLEPSSLGRVAWSKMFSIALDDLSEQILPKVIVVCEGSSQGKTRKNFDADIYTKIFKDSNTDFVFISGDSSNEIKNTSDLLKIYFNKVNLQVKVIALSDRDDKSIDEVKEWESAGNIMLSERNIESYLFADDVLMKLAQVNGKEDLIESIIKIKEEKLSASVARKNPPDDLKSAAGEIYNELRLILSLQQCGNNANSFMRDTLAPLITQDMDTYVKLKNTIIDKINHQLSRI
jgi:AAA15 family ATPase/GTPase